MPKQDNPLNSAARTGDAQKVYGLLSARTPISSAIRNTALIAAAANGHASCVVLLIPHSDPKACDSKALLRAAEEGHVECVNLLIPASNPTANKSAALQKAVLRGHEACVDVLLGVSDVEQALMGIKQERLRRFGTKDALPLEIDLRQRDQALFVRAALEDNMEDNMYDNPCERVRKIKI